MKKFTYLLLLPVIVLCFYGFTFKKETKALTLSGKIQADLLALKIDLALNSDCGSSASVISSSEVNNGRLSLNSKFMYSPTDSSHCGVLCINDVIKMLTENDGNTINNSIICYPIVNNSGNPSIAFVGAQLVGALDNKGKINVSTKANHYLSTWCPSLCPANADGIIK